MAAEKEEPSAFGKLGDSVKENIYTGSMPGGEAFYKAWTESSMKTDFRDIPGSFQKKSEYKPKFTKKTGVSAMLGNIEFFKGFSREPAPARASLPAFEYVPALTAKVVAPTIASEGDAPSDSLYAPHFPARLAGKCRAYRELQRKYTISGPEIKLTFQKDYSKVRVSVAMTGVTPSPTDRFYPREMKNKAPMVDIFYNGNLAAAYVSVKLDDVDCLPTLAPPPKEGDAITTLSPGRAGGLKLAMISHARV